MKNSQNPAKVYIGIDASGKPGFLEQEPFRIEDFHKPRQEDWFTVANVVTHNLDAAAYTVEEIDSQYGTGKKGKNLHSAMDEIVALLSQQPLCYFVSSYNRYICPPEFASGWRKDDGVVFLTREFRNHPLVKQFSMPGWLTIDALRKAEYKGFLEVRADRDLSGAPWDKYMSDIETHARSWIGHCDIQAGDDSYPLIRIADIVANFVRTQHAEKKLENNRLKLISALYDKYVPITYQVTRKHEGGYTIFSQAYDPDAEYATFFPWQRSENSGRKPGDLYQ